MKKSILFISPAALLATVLAWASGPHTSASYSVQPAAIDGGGAFSASANYSHHGSVFDIAGTGGAGVYSAGHGYISQLVPSVVSGCPEFIAWQTTHFGSPSAPNAAPGMDPDLDGVENQNEFAFNMNPLTPDTAPLPPGGTGGLPRFATELVGGRLRLTVEFIRRAGCLDYQLEASGELADWAPIAPEEVGAAVPLPGGLERVKWAENALFGDYQRRFLRIRVKM